MSQSFGFFFQVFGTMSELLSWNKFDAAVLMVPHHLHVAYATACLHSNKHVLLEKPLAHSLESAVSLLEEVGKTTSSVCMIGEQSPHWPEVRMCLVSFVTAHVDLGILNKQWYYY